MRIRALTTALAVAASLTVAVPAHADTFPCQYDADGHTLVVLGGTHDEPGAAVTVRIRHHRTRHYRLPGSERIIRTLPFRISTSTVRVTVSGHRCETT